MIRKMKNEYYRRKEIYFRMKTLISSGFGRKNNDYFLVSYPKSGNTWVRFILANLFKSDQESINFTNVGEYVPDIYKEMDIQTLRNDSSGFNNFSLRLLKTHDNYSFIFKNTNVVYVARDGRDTLTSYYYYINARKETPVKLQDIIIQGTTYGLWSNHVLNWIKSRDHKKFFLLKYEDMRTNALIETKKLLTFLDLKIEEESIKKSISLSTVTKMKIIEHEFGHPVEKRVGTGKNVPFVRKAQIGDWKNLFSEKDTRLFWKYHSKGMDILGYEKNV
ncbi:MAG: sulfotransferase domain-containing protein [Chloroflexi bacterium]|jgi:hypothetical protein|nr:sulfotransferase domain-containing protein [Chloroflexota bacterium]MBT4002499.1 sulfotransferase domain-containing protein [Chloroflexota bacterium]MBT4306214.1 sulfotransferase domain-containing protein [Chloroflexota bacterium]MBT4534997.1 sulfotransferase domain-containing protein [Chloroflexota bacterium]MBT6358513.1 sulfotransferase domain-containing protein [Chloroflexota bacterium]